MSGRFESGLDKEHKFAWGSIFSNKYYITVITPSFTVIFHRWGAPRGHYTKCWRLFRQELLRRKINSIYDVYRYANKYDITHFVKHTKRAPSVRHDLANSRPTGEKYTEVGLGSDKKIKSEEDD